MKFKALSGGFQRHRTCCLVKTCSPWVEFPSLLQLLLPVYPRPRLRLHVILVHGVLVGEAAVDLAQVRVDLFARLFVDGAAHRPYHREHEPQLNHLGKVVHVRRINLHSIQTPADGHFDWRRGSVIRTSVRRTFADL